jgi:UPF0755 protein
VDAGKPASSPATPSTRTARRGSSRSRSSGCLILLTIALGLLAAVWIRSTATSPVEHDPDRIITIDPGMGSRGVLARLNEAGIVRHPLALRLYLLVAAGGGSLKAGDYKFPSPVTPVQALESIKRGEIYYEHVTIPEGFNRFEIAELLASKTGKASAGEFLRLMDDTAPIARLAPGATNLEGYLFPDTYAYISKTTPEDFIRAAVRRFQEAFTQDMAARASQIQLSVNQVVTLASLIEKEARVPGDRALIASVVMNRLRLGMPLAVDQTFIYAALLAGDYDGNPNQPRHRQRQSLYNTYLHAGLPPGPIASPGRASIEAALYPAETDYLYYVLASPDGHHKFSRTAAEHDVAVEQYHQMRHLQNSNRQ